MSGVIKIDSSVALIFDIHIKFLDKFITVLLTLPVSLTTLLFFVLNIFRANSLDNLVVFKKEISGVAILLKF